MKLIIVLENIKDLALEDAGWIRGYLIIEESNFSLSIFNTSGCMVMLAVTDLLDFLINIRKKSLKKYKWVGVDNGTLILISVTTKAIKFKGKNCDAVFNLDQLKYAVFESANQFIMDCRSANKNIDNESGFLDLKKTFFEYSKIYFPDSVNK